MVSKKNFIGDNGTTRFLSDFIIVSELFARPYIYIYDTTLSPLGTEDHLQDDTLPWSYPDNLWVRGTDTPEPSEDVVPVTEWDVVDNSILFYTPPPIANLLVEVATTPEELGTTFINDNVEEAIIAAYVSVQAANRSEDAADVSELEAWEAEAEAKTAQSTANAPLDVLTTIFTSNGDGSFTETPSSWYSAFHWEEKAKFLASGLEYVGTWDASLGTFPPDGDTTGQFYIVSVSGVIGTEPYNVGDWMIWDQDALVWGGVHWKFSWTIASDVTVEGAVPAIGDDLARNGTAYTKAESDATNLVQDDAITLNTTNISANTTNITANATAISDEETRAIAAEATKPTGSWAFDGTTLAITIP